MIAAIRSRFGPLLFTGALLLLISVAVTDRIGSWFHLVMLASVGASAAAIQVMYPENRLFTLAFANLLGVYTLIFTFFVQANFAALATWAQNVGFVLPIGAFLGGIWLRRLSIRAIVMSERLRDERHLGHVFLWLVPVFAIGGLTFWIPGRGIAPQTADLLFVLAMAGIAAIVFWVSRDVSTFMIDTGLLFEELFHRVRALVAPAFAFFTFYSLLIILFACLYRVIDRYSELPQFMRAGEPYHVSFQDSLYFSLITLATVGYGDIVPRTALMQVLVATQVVSGLLLLLFGFYEIVSYARERRHRRGDTDS
ncbi:MAG: potassium channel protein [Alphaproteobacteria bacterium]|nr:potassium channel protein [Alphaproteobacteria bacterium]